MDELETYRTSSKNPKIHKRSADLAKYDDLRGKKLKMKEAQWKIERHKLELTKLEENFKKAVISYETAKKLLESSEKVKLVNNKPKVNLNDLFDIWVNLFFIKKI